MATYQQGELAIVRGTFTNPETGAPVDPSVVKVTIVSPDGQRNEYLYGTDAQVVKDSIGVYSIEVGCDIPGTFAYWWHSGGTGKAGDERTFTVTAAIGADPPGAPGTLDLTYPQILREVGRLVGQREPNKWPPEMRGDVADIIRSGLRRFYWSPVLPNADGKGATVHTWSFLTATSTISLAANDSMYALPDDFGEMLDGVFTHAAGSGASKPPIGIIKEEQLRQLQAAANVTGTPKYAAIRQVAGTPMRYEALFYPTPDAAVTLTFDYSIAPPDLSETHPHPYGGPQHAETILEAILAEAEKKLLDERDGLHEKLFLECLARSITADRNLNNASDESPWPLDEGVPADGLNVTKAYLKRVIGRKLGYGTHPGTWSHAQASDVNGVLEAGLRKFYNPMVLPGERTPHEWSFLRPVHYLTTAGDVSRYDLPDDFSIIDGPIIHAPTAATIYAPIPIVGESQVRMRQEAQLGSARPQIAAVRPKPIDASGITRWELIMHPTPDGTYSLSFRYQSNPTAMPEDACLPYGGQPHAQTVVEACLCAAEEQMASLGTLTTKQLVHGQKFLECLTRSIGHDRKASSPTTLGRNTDASDMPVEGNWHETQSLIHTYNGTRW